MCLYIGFVNAQCIAGDCTNGNGTYKLPNGDMYTGSWVNGVREGYGRYDWANGSYYVGDFKNNLLHGNGSFYGTDGRQMTGVFYENNFVENPAETDTTKEFDPNADINAQLDSVKQMDSIARAETYGRAQRVPFCSLIQKLTADFGNQFTSYLGERQAIILERGMNWYATVMAEESLEAGVTGEKGLSARSYYTILYESADSASAMQQYEKYVELLKECDNGCCTMVYDEYDFAGKIHRSYSTTWATLQVKEGLEPLLYQNMMMELECFTSAVRGGGWLVVYRMYDMEMLR